MLSLVFGWLSSIFFKIFLAGFLSGGASFKKPLSEEDEKKYLLMMKNGDDEARNLLIEHNLRLVAHIVKKYSVSLDADADDLISIGTIGLIKAIDNFDCEKNAKLATYASRCIANEILMYMRATKNKGREISLNEPIGTDEEGNSISLINILCDDDSDMEEKMVLKSQIKVLYECVEHALSEREKKILALRYGLFGKKAHTQMEIAKMMNISRSYVSRIEKKIIEKLYESFKDARF